MDKTSLTTLLDQQLATARAAAGGRSAHTVYGGHTRTLRQTLITLLAGQRLDEHENPGEATIQVLVGRVRLTTAETSCDAAAGELLEYRTPGTPWKHSTTRRSCSPWPCCAEAPQRARDPTSVDAHGAQDRDDELSGGERPQIPPRRPGRHRRPPSPGTGPTCSLRMFWIGLDACEPAVTFRHSVILSSPRPTPYGVIRRRSSGADGRQERPDLARRHPQRPSPQRSD